MPMSFQQRYDAATDAAFQSRVKQAIWQQAVWVMSASAESEGYQLAEYNHPNHVDRVILARKVTEGLLEQGIDPIIMARNILSMSQTAVLDGVTINNLADEQLQGYVQMCWDHFI